VISSGTKKKKKKKNPFYTQQIKQTKEEKNLIVG